MTVRCAILLLLGSLLLPASSLAEKLGPALNQQLVHHAYNEGNFDFVISHLETFQKENKTFSQDDSVFIAKHLAVVYSANPATREKGRYYMNRLLELLPSAKLLDMYVSEEIDRIFEKVREEFLARQRSFGIDRSAVNLPDREGRAAPAQPARPAEEAKTGKLSEGRKNRGLIWFAGGLGVAAAVGTFAYFAMHEDPKAEDKTYVVSE